MSRFHVFLLSFMLVFFVLYSYLVLTSVPTANSVRLGLGNNFLRLAVSFSFVLPLFVSFYFGCWSAKLLFKVRLRYFSIAILILTLILLFNSLLGQIRTHFFNGPEMQKIFIIVTNYIYTFGHLIGFYLLFLGTRQMLLSSFKKWNIIVTCIVVLLIGTFYGLMLFTNPDRTLPSIPGTVASHYLSDPLIFLTIFVPVLLGWGLAITSAFSLIEVFSVPSSQEQEKGSGQILYGLLFIIFSDIILQVILSIGTKRILDIGLPLTLGALYIFVIALVAGNFLIMLGARKYINTT